MSGVKITAKPCGPLVVEGRFDLVGLDGKPVALPESRKYLLCRCGASKVKPFCDGAHNRVRFELPAPAEDDGAEPQSASKSAE